MKARYNSRADRLRRHGNGRALKNNEPAEMSIITQRKLEAKIFNLETHILCTECGRVVARRADGTMKAHRSQGVIPCIAASPRIPGSPR